MSLKMGAVMIFSVALATPALAQSNVASDHKYCWGENIGYLNWRDAGLPVASQGARVRASILSGFPDTRAFDGKLGRSLVEELSAAGFAPEILSAGSTPAALHSARHPVTDERPGTYVFQDAQQVALGVATLDDVALFVAATVVAAPGALASLLDTLDPDVKPAPTADVWLDADRLAAALRQGVGEATERQRGFGALSVHPGTATALYTPSSRPPTIAANTSIP